MPRSNNTVIAAGKLGLDPCVPIDRKQVAGGAKLAHEVHSIGGGSLFVCLSTAIPQAYVEPLALGVVAWHRELRSAGEATVVFRDSAFADDVAKTNLAAILNQHGLTNVCRRQADKWVSDRKTRELSVGVSYVIWRPRRPNDSAG